MLKLTIIDATAPPPRLAGEAVEVWRDDGGAVCAYGGTVDGRSWMHLPGLASFSFDGVSDEVIAVPDASVRPGLIVDAYQRSVLPLALQARDTEVLHASAVLAPCGVVALCAVSGTGKSTLAVGLSRRGYRLWGDDAVGFTSSGQHVKAIPMPFDIHLRPAAAAFFGCDPWGVPAASNGDTAEATRPVPLAMLWVLERAETPGSGVVVERLRPSAAFPAVLKHAYCFSLRDLERKRRMTQQYLELTARVPVFLVRFQPGLERLSTLLDLIEQALDEISR